MILIDNFPRVCRAFLALLCLALIPSSGMIGCVSKNDKKPVLRSLPKLTKTTPNNARGLRMGPPIPRPLTQFKRSSTKPKPSKQCYFIVAIKGMT